MFSFLFFENSVKKISYQMLRHAKQIKKRSCFGTWWGRKPRTSPTYLLVSWGATVEPQRTQYKNHLSKPSISLHSASSVALLAAGEGLYSPCLPPTPSHLMSILHSHGQHKYRYLLPKPSLHTACTNQLKVTVYKNQCLVCALGFCGL